MFRASSPLLFFCALFVCAVVLAHTTPADAAVFRLRSGEPITGAYIGKENGEVLILDAEGRKQRIAEADILTVDWTTLAPKSVERKAKRARKQHLVKRKRAATKLVKKLMRAKPDERPELKAQLETFEEPELMPALDKGIRSSDEHVRNYAFGKLKSLESPGAIVPLVNYVLVGRDDAFKARAHDTALRKQPDKTREVYEYVALSGGVEHRLTALAQVGQIGNPQSVPRIAQLLTYVEANIRAQLVRAKRVREEPVSLSGATNVTIDLPEVELIEVMTTARVPVVSLKRIQGGAVQALQAITGADYGTDAAAWKRWYEEYRLREPADPKDAPEKPDDRGNR